MGSSRETGGERNRLCSRLQGDGEEGEEEDVIQTVHDAMTDFFSAEEEADEEIEDRGDVRVQFSEEDQEETVEVGKKRKTASGRKESCGRSDSEEIVEKKVKGGQKEAVRETPEHGACRKSKRDRKPPTTFEAFLMEKPLAVASREQTNQAMDAPEKTSPGLKILNVRTLAPTTGPFPRGNKNTSRTVDRSVQTMVAKELTTNSRKSGKVLTIGSFQPAKVSAAARPRLTSVLERSKAVQTSPKPNCIGRVMYARKPAPVTMETEAEEPIFDCTFHKFCILNKTKFRSKEDLTRHIVCGFREQPHPTTEPREQNSYCPRPPGPPDPGSTTPATGKQPPVQRVTNQNKIITHQKVARTQLRRILPKPAEPLLKTAPSRGEPRNEGKTPGTQNRGSSGRAGGVPSKASRDSEGSETGTGEEGERALDCPVCSEQFSETASVYTHMRTAHTDAFRPANNLSKRTGGRAAAKLNRKSLPEVEDVKPDVTKLSEALTAQGKILVSTKELTQVVYPCKVCRAIFYHDFELEGHIASAHRAPPDPAQPKERRDDNATHTKSPPVTQPGGVLRCPVCSDKSITFSNASQLQLHLSASHGVQAKVVTMGDNKDAANHVTGYGGHFECPVCALIFATSTDMYAHLNATHLNRLAKT